MYLTVFKRLDKGGAELGISIYTSNLMKTDKDDSFLKAIAENVMRISCFLATGYKNPGVCWHISASGISACKRFRFGFQMGSRCHSQLMRVQ